MEKLSRRQFLAAGGMMAGAALLPGGIEAAAMGKKEGRVPLAAKAGPTLRFRPDGKFKILQLTDTHYIASKPELSNPMLDDIRNYIRIERPDLIIHTGDTIYTDMNMAAFETLMKPIFESGIPFAVTWGNHDHADGPDGMQFRADMQKRQEDGTYYCCLYEYRCFNYETKAEYKSDSVLEIVDDEISGTIKVNDYDVDVSFIESNGDEVDISYTNCKYEYSDISQYTGNYTYKKTGGSEVTISVGYDDNRSPVITVEDGSETVEYTHNPSDCEIFILEDKDYGDILYASIESEVWGPDSEVFSFTQGYRGDKYLVIRFDGNTPYVYFKTYNPVVMH